MAANANFALPADWSYSGPTVNWSQVLGASGGTVAGAPSQSAFPTSIPSYLLGSPAITPVNAQTPGATPVAQGFDLMMQMLNSVLNAEKLRQSAVDQTVNIAQLVAELQRSSPTRAADLATSLGIPGLEPDLSFANAFSGDRSTGVFGGRVGTQDINLPFAFSGKELSFLTDNQNVAKVLNDVAERFGRPDLLRTSLSSLIPAGGIYTN